jgi:acetyl esterase
MKIPASTGDLYVYLVRPKETEGPTPAILYFHGGGWVVGDRFTHARLVADLSNAAGATILFVEYGLSPENKFPVAIEQAYSALEYIYGHSGDFGIDPNRIFVAGDSSGANLATVACLLASQRHGPTIMGQLLFYPTVSAAMDTASYQEFAEGPWLTRRSMEWFWTQYLPESTERTNPLVSPLYASGNELGRFPATLLITAECDVLRDEGEAYARKLMEAGVEVTTVRFGGAIHDFMMLNAIADSAPTCAAIGLAANFVQRVSRI